MIRRKQTNTFVKKNIVFILLAAFFCILGSYGKYFYAAAFLVFFTAIAISPIEHKFCWSLFLVPNIRILDGLGPEMLVNMLMVLPLAFYFALKLMKREFNIMGFPLFGAFLLFMMETLHMSSISSESISVLAWALTFAWCGYATLDKDIKLKRRDIIYSFALGIIFSALLYIINNPDYTANIIDNIFEGERFAGYGDDPNYYSLYICITLASIVAKSKIRLLDYIIIVALICIGFLTASKMCLILIIVNLLYLVLGTNTSITKAVRNVFIMIIVVIAVFIFKDLIQMFIDNLLQRSGGRYITLDTFTSGRSDLVFDYINILSKDYTTLFFGKGFSYHLRFPGIVTHGAHNTYLDFILAWGIVGVIFLFNVLKIWIDGYRNKLRAISYTRISKFPALMLLLNFCDLSCFSAGMFFLVISVAMLQLRPVRQVRRRLRKSKDANISKIARKKTVIIANQPKPISERWYRQHSKKDKKKVNR